MKPLFLMTLDKKARQIWVQAGAVLLAEHPKHDASEHLGLLTVIAGLRPVALFLDIEPANATKVIRLVKPLGLSGFMAAGPAVAYTWESVHPPEVTAVFRNRGVGMGLWVCRKRDHVHLIGHGINQIETGRLLQYPQCCIDDSQRSLAEVEDIIIRGFVREYGSNPRDLGRAWIGNRKITVDRNPMGDETARTQALFPFVQHTACRSCLEVSDSATSRLDSEYGDLVRAVDSELHGYLSRNAAELRLELIEQGIIKDHPTG